MNQDVFVRLYGSIT